MSDSQETESEDTISVYADRLEDPIESQLDTDLDPDNVGVGEPAVAQRQSLAVVVGSPPPHSIDDAELVSTLLQPTEDIDAPDLWEQRELEEAAAEEQDPPKPDQLFRPERIRCGRRTATPCLSSIYSTGCAVSRSWTV